jgi:hypothetical protein
MTDNDTLLGWFENILERLQPMALAMINDETEHVPMFLVYSSDRPHKVAAIPLFELNNDVKDAAFGVLRSLGSSDGVHAAILVTEAWTVERSTDDPRASDMTRSLEFEPDRQETMIWNCVSHGQQLMAMRKIDRTTKGWGGELKIIDPSKDMMSGRMVADDKDTSTRH